jgi:hypothetical protein
MTALKVTREGSTTFWEIVGEAVCFVQSVCNFAAYTVDGSVTETRTLKGDTLASYKKDPREHESPEDATEYAKEVVEAKRKRGYQDAAFGTTHKLLELEDSDDDSQDFESPKKRKKSSHKDKKKKSHRDKKHKKKKSHRERERD